jgi:tetratricopeptide (TPR) repeat protein
MQIMPFLALVFATLSVLLHFAGQSTAMAVAALVTALCGLVGLAVGVAEKPISSRVASLLAILLGFAPFAEPPLQEMRRQSLERRRALETAGQYRAIDDSVSALTPLLLAYRQSAGFFPDFHNGQQLPVINPQGILTQPPPAAPIAPPRDPFSPTGASMRWAAVRDWGVLMVSVGQDGVVELPLPGVLMDGGAHPLAGFAAVGQDTRLVTYDPTNGALGLGDVVRWVGTVAEGPMFAPLHAAWDLAERRSRWSPTKLRRATEPDPDPQSARDGLAAERLLIEGEYLAALALASRALNHRHAYQAQWKPGDMNIQRTRGLALYNLGAFREAADALVDHLATTPNDATAHFFAAAALFAGGRRDFALVHAAAAAQIDAGSPFANPAQQRYEEMLRGQAPGFPAPLGVGWTPTLNPSGDAP